jgi:outer membrane immunogenic protein
MKATVKLSIGALALAGMALPASAADLARPITKGPIAAPPPVFSWSGCYVGANAGWIGGRDKFLLTPSGNYLNPAGAAAPPNAAGTGLLGSDIAIVTDAFRGTDDGFAGGGQVGCNWQTGFLVLGAEADFNGTSLDRTFARRFGPVPSDNPAFTIGSETDAVSKRLDWFSTIRGRVGFAFDRWLIYGTGGVVFGDFRSATNVSFTPVAGTLPVFDTSVHAGGASRTRAEAVYGGGVEYAFTNNWTVKVEYLHFELSRLTYVSPLVASAVAVAPGYSWTTRVREIDDTVRVGVNYKFDWFFR